MEPYEIIKEIRNGTSANSLEVLNGARCWSLNDLIDNLLSMPLTPSIFVPCKDGKPLEVPKGKQPSKKIWQPYNEAQKAVIFEGWEVVKTGETFYIQNEHWGIYWHGEYDNKVRLFPRITNDFDVLYWGIRIDKKIKTIADLAAATIEKPLKFK